METYFLQPNQEAVLSLYNGTFDKSENIITRDRMLDASIVSSGNRVPIDSAQWQDKDSTITQLNFKTDAPGTYLAGVSTKARNIELSAEKFNDYLKHDGVLDMLEYRKAKGLLEQDAVESYQKHVKAIYQVGELKTNDWNVVLNYPIEFVPLTNPYEKYSGDDLGVRLLSDGKPLAGQLVFADYIPNAHSYKHGEDKHGHDHGEGGHSLEADHHGDAHGHKHDSETDPGHTHTGGQQLRTNREGLVTVDLPEDGVYYLRTIQMNIVENDELLTHRSKWATLTFEVSHKHGESTHVHEEHDHSGEIPTWIFIVGSLVIIGILFLIFRKNN